MAPGEEEAACRLSEREESAMRARRPADNQEETAWIYHTYICTGSTCVHIKYVYIYTPHISKQSKCYIIYYEHSKSETDRSQICSIKLLEREKMILCSASSSSLVHSTWSKCLPVSRGLVSRCLRRDGAVLWVQSIRKANWTATTQ